MSDQIYTSTNPYPETSSTLPSTWSSISTNQCSQSNHQLVSMASEKRSSPGSSEDGNGVEHIEKKEGLGGYAVDPEQMGRSNLNAMFDNPLAGIPKDQLFNDVKNFCDKHGLTEHYDTFCKGALVAQSPHAAQQLDILSSEEKRHLEREHTHKWSQTWDLYWLVIMCSLCAAVQGMDEVCSSHSLDATPNF